MKNKVKEKHFEIISAKSYRVDLVVSIPAHYAPLNSYCKPGDYSMFTVCAGKGTRCQAPPYGLSCYKILEKEQ